MPPSSLSDEIALENKALRQVEYYKFSPPDWSHEETPATVDNNLLSAIAKEQTGFHALFLPPIGDKVGIYDPDKEPKTNQRGPGWEDGWHSKLWSKPDEEAIQILIDKYKIPRWFLQTMGWNANGFFGSLLQLQPAPSNGYVQAIYSRFLSKEVKEANNDIGYGWTFMSFYLRVRVSANPEVQNSAVLLCFDLPERLRTRVLAILKDIDYNPLLRVNPMGILARIFFGVVIVEFERGLWSFRAPIRKIEERRNALLAPPEGRTKDEDKVKQLENGARDIYELLRHALHIKETIDVASISLQAAYEEHLDLPALRERQPDPGAGRDKIVLGQTTRTLRLSRSFASSYAQRAEAFANRLKNEAKIISSLASTRLLNRTIEDGRAEAKSDHDLLESIKELLEQTKDDGSKFAQRISMLTLLLLPGTLVAGFFGMNFFTLSDNKALEVNKHLYLFFLFTIPITWVCLKWSRMDPKESKKPGKIARLRSLVNLLSSLSLYFPYRTHQPENHELKSSSVSSETGSVAPPQDGDAEPEAHGSPTNGTSSRDG